MSIDLSPDVWNEIQRQTSSGSYASPDEVVRVALAAPGATGSASAHTEPSPTPRSHQAKDQLAPTNRPLDHGSPIR